MDSFYIVQPWTSDSLNWELGTRIQDPTVGLGFLTVRWRGLGQSGSQWAASLHCPRQALHWGTTTPSHCYRPLSPSTCPWGKYPALRGLFCSSQFVYGTQFRVGKRALSFWSE